MADSKKIRSLLPVFILIPLLFFSIFLSIQNQTLSQDLQNLRDRSKKLEASLSEAEENAKTLLEKSQKSEEEKSAALEQLAVLKKEHEALQLEFQQLESQWKSSSEEKIFLEEMILNKTKALKKLQEISDPKTVDLGSIQVQAPPSAAKSVPSPSNGHVLAVNDDHGFVVIDLGKEDQLASDTLFEVRHGDQIAAVLSILEIRDEMSACNIKTLADGAKIQVNDPVFIQS